MSAQEANIYFIMKHTKVTPLDRSTLVLSVVTEGPNKENITAFQRAQFDLPDSQLTGFSSSSAGFKPTLIHNKSPSQRGGA